MLQLVRDFDSIIMGPDGRSCDGFFALGIDQHTEFFRGGTLPGSLTFMMGTMIYPAFELASNPNLQDMLKQYIKNHLRKTLTKCLFEEARARLAHAIETHPIVDEMVDAHVRFGSEIVASERGKIQEEIFKKTLQVFGSISEDQKMSAMAAAVGSLPFPTQWVDINIADKSTAQGGRTVYGLNGYVRVHNNIALDSRVLGPKNQYSTLISIFQKSVRAGLCKEAVACLSKVTVLLSLNMDSASNPRMISILPQAGYQLTNIIRRLMVMLNEDISLTEETKKIACILAEAEKLRDTYAKFKCGTVTDFKVLLSSIFETLTGAIVRMCRMPKCRLVSWLRHVDKHTPTPGHPKPTYMSMGLALTWKHFFAGEFIKNKGVANERLHRDGLFSFAEQHNLLGILANMISKADISADKLLTLQFIVAWSEITKNGGIGNLDFDFGQFVAAYHAV